MCVYCSYCVLTWLCGVSVWLDKVLSMCGLHNGYVMGVTVLCPCAKYVCVCVSEEGFYFYVLEVVDLLEVFS